MRKPVLLVVDDDESIRRYLSALLSSLGYEVRSVDSGEKALAYLASNPAPATVLLDVLMPGMSGLETLDRLKSGHPRVPVIVLSTLAQISTVVDAMRRGASDYLTKPFEEPELELAIQNVLEKQDLRDEVLVLRRRLDGETDFVSASPRMVRIKQVARQVADTDAPVLLLGQSGVGKEVVARYVHGSSRRRARPFVKVNCAALPDDLLESELFGYERGAFSGALRQKPGLFEQADGGTILLDEIGEMGFHLQAKLLHVLQDGEYTRLGGTRPIAVDARVVAATNADLDRAVAAGRFRDDLYFRLNVIRLEIPPLKDRPEDVPLLAAHFLRSYTSRYGSALRELPLELRDAFQGYDWPGNVRELENAIRRFVILGDLESSLSDLRRHQLRSVLVEPSDACLPPRPEAERLDGVSLRKVAAQAAEEAERELLTRVLTETRWNRKEAASQLQISYKALLNKLKKWEDDGVLRGPRAGADADESSPRPAVSRFRSRSDRETQLRRS